MKLEKNVKIISKQAKKGNNKYKSKENNEIEKEKCKKENK